MTEKRNRKSKETERSRTEYSALNASTAMISRIVSILMGFVTRVVFTHVLSESYVGINGLFMDIINVLSLSELGIGTAITYALYRPIAEGDIEKQKSLMKLFQRFYRIVAGLVLTAGLAVLPFMGILVKEQGDINHLTLIYLLYLANSVLSYLYIYKRTLIDAHQLKYIGTLYYGGFLVLQYILQIIVLLTTGNFILYLLVYLLCTLGNNLGVSKKADQLYPFLRERNVQKLPEAEQKDIFKNTGAMLMHRIGGVVVNNTDNLLLSSMAGLLSVACYSNYFLVIGSVRQVLNELFVGITASVGNLGVTEDRDQVKKIFEAAFFIGQWVYGLAAICLFELLNPFISISFGEQYVFAPMIVLVLCINFYINGMRQATLVFRDSLGLFWYDRYKSLVEAGINLVVSIVLALRWGAIGVFLGTFVSTVTTSTWVEPWVLYKFRFERKVGPYFLLYSIYTGILTVIALLTHAICMRITGELWLVLVCRAAVCMILPNILLTICYCRTRNFRLLLKTGMELLDGIRK